MTKREAILQATIELVAEKGIADAPTVLLAKRAGAAEFTLFRLFGNKSNLLDETFDVVMNRFREMYLQTATGSNDIEAKLRDLLSIAVEYYRNKPEELAYIQRYTHSPAGEHRSPNRQCAMGKDVSNIPVFSLLVQGKNQGIFKNISNTALLGLAIVPIIMVLRDEQVIMVKHSAAEMQRVIDACVQGVKAL
jgi:AcrR family transcriptional regulator